jgi:ATP-binding cassette subfamily C (CFTR/MRP) protein 1
MTLTSSLGSLVLVIYATPLFAVAIVPLLAIYYAMQQVYRQTSRELKRLDSISRSPLYAHYGESMNGISTIRAYKKTDEFIKVCAERLDNTVAPNFVLLSSQRWLSFRLEILGSFIVFFAATFAVMSRVLQFFLTSSIPCPLR